MILFRFQIITASCERSLRKASYSTKESYGSESNLRFATNHLKILKSSFLWYYLT